MIQTILTEVKLKYDPGIFNVSCIQDAQKIEKSHKNTVPSKRGMSVIKMKISWPISGKHPQILIF